MSINSSSGQCNDRRLLWGWAVALIIVTIVSYRPAIGAGWIWDDDYHITRNIDLLTLHGLSEIWTRLGAVPQYYPLTHTTFWIEFHLWRYNTVGYHLDNILLHAANAVLVGLILRRLSVPDWWLAAAIFALHPVQVESVAWVTERKNVLSGFLFLSALWFALDVWQISPGPQKSQNNLRYYLCLLLFVLALLSKTVTASLPAVILLLIWWKRRRITFREFATLLPFFIIGGAMGSLTAWMERHVVGAVGSDWSWTFPQRILIASRAVGFYWRKLLWPHPLIFAYPKWPLTPLQWLIPIAIVLLLAILWLTCRAAFVGIVFFLIVIFPALGFANTYPMRFSFVADHFQYLACIGPIALIAALIRRPIVGIPLLLILACLTWEQSKTYADSETLWRDVVAKDPRSLVGLSNLGAVLTAKGDLTEAAAILNRAVAIDPHFVEARLSLGSIAEARHDPALARQIYEAAAADSPTNPLPYWNLGMWDRRYGDAATAIAEFTKAAQYLPNPAKAFEQIGEILLQAHNFHDAFLYFTQALASNPDLLEAHNNLAAMYLEQGSPADLAAAQTQCEATLAVDPNNATACNNMAVILGRQGKMDEALEYAQRALKRDADSAIARQNLNLIRP